MITVWTAADWQRAPWLLSAKQVRAGTGCTKRDLQLLRTSGQLHQRKFSRKGKYYKQEVLAVFGIREINGDSHG